MTVRQFEILCFLKEFHKRHGYMPTIKDIVFKFNYKKRNGAVWQLNKLEKLGVIKKLPLGTMDYMLS